MLPENGAALVGAAVLTVLVLPTVAVAITRPGPDTGRDVVARRPDEVAG
ncbi:hypothetical protein ACFQV8_24085 [Pseudonocardia benzenivorans]